jgi:hypothetical protein
MRTYLKNAVISSCIVVAAVGALPMMSASADYTDYTAVRLRRLEDVEKIKELKYNYVALLDELIADPDAADDFVDLFVSNLEVEYDAYGTFTDKTTLTAFLKNVISPAFAWGFHTAQNPRIDVYGDYATAEWYLTAQTVAEGGTEVVPFYGRYVDHYVRTCDGWKIKQSVLVFDFPPVQ